MRKTIADSFPARRDILKLGGYGLLGAFADQALAPVAARAAGKANPRGTARFGIVVELAGAISHVDTFDFKETAGTPKDLDVRPVNNNSLYLSHKLFPELSKEMHRISVVRSLKSHEVVHFRGQYYTQAGRPLNPVQAPEIPSVGSVIAQELESQRRETDSFPTYVGCNLDTSGCGALSTGFLHPRHSVLDINLKAGVGGVAVDGDALKLLEERYRLLSELEKVTAPRRQGRDRAFGAFHSFQDSAYSILRDPRWPKAFQIDKEERARYGDNEVGLGCLLARNLIQADAGTRYIHVVHPDWDHHKAIFTPSAKSNHYIRCNEMDAAVANLIRDLGAAPSPRDKSKTLLDETFIAVVSEFGRVPGALNGNAGRHHYNLAYHALFAGAGAKGGRILGKTDAAGEHVLDSGWRYKKMQTKTENIYATMYSSLGIDWKKEITNTPSKRAYRYIDVLGATEFVMDDEIVELFV
ncbi:MAG TPA: DUF1501 domain-containing protein [Bryobacteraceae bacterium]|jgi:hypothetical protein|nr:DUF1501 domain-containing protein [Bryobacteraceae bacterium]